MPFGARIIEMHRNGRAQNEVHHQQRVARCHEQLVARCHEERVARCHEQGRGGPHRVMRLVVRRVMWVRCYLAPQARQLGWADRPDRLWWMEVLSATFRGQGYASTVLRALTDAPREYVQLK